MKGNLVEVQIVAGDCRDILPTLEAGSVQCCVTSPPYWGLRDYGTAQWEGGDAGCDHIETWNLKRDHSGGLGGTSGNSRGNQSSTTSSAIQYRDICKCGARRIDSQLGLESTPEQYITGMVAVFREVGRVLRDDGTLWVNLGDSYNSQPGQRKPEDKIGSKQATNRGSNNVGSRSCPGLKPKDLCMMPARLAMALQADGWYLRSEIVWHKPNPMPESVTDRPTKAHEMIYLLTKNGGKPLIWRARDTGEWSNSPDLSETIKELRSPPTNGGLSTWPTSKNYNGAALGEDGKRIPETRDEEVPRWKGFDYFYDAEAIREPANPEHFGRYSYSFGGPKAEFLTEQEKTTNGTRLSPIGNRQINEFRNKRSVWTIATQPYAEAHFATFPEEIPKLCILAGSRIGDTVLDPFAGSGTTGQVALELGRRAVLIELNPAYVELANARTFVTPGFL